MFKCLLVHKRLLDHKAFEAKSVLEALRIAEKITSSDGWTLKYVNFESPNGFIGHSESTHLDSGGWMLHIRESEAEELLAVDESENKGINPNF